MIYLDAAATAKYTCIDDVVVDTITTAMKDSWINPSSLYAANVKDKINKCRANIAKFIGANADEIYFTSGASESNNWAIRGWVDYYRLDDYKSINVITTATEHKSILNVVNSLCKDAIIRYCNVDKFGIVDLRDLRFLLDICCNNKEPILVSVSMANNEIGTIQSIKEIADLTHRYNGVLHVDATQAFGHIPINVEELNIDMMSCSGHKVSPVLRGVGFLYKNNRIDIQPLIYGSQERNLRGGTENTYGIIGLNKALEYCDVSIPTIEELSRKRDYFINRLVEEFGCTINGSLVKRLPNNINATFPQDITGESLLYILDIADIKISVGSACNSKEIMPSHVLKAINLTDSDAMKTVRFTICEDITYEDIDKVIDEIKLSIKLIIN